MTNISLQNHKCCYSVVLQYDYGNEMTVVQFNCFTYTKSTSALDMKMIHLSVKADQ